MKKLIVLMLAGTLLVGSAVTPKRADAIVGAVTNIAGGAGFPALILGGVLIASGATIMNVTDPGSATTTTNAVISAIGFVGGAGLTVLGFILLDEQNSSLSFAALTPDKAAALGISTDEMQSFNSELEELNAIADQASVAVRSSGARTVSDATEASSLVWKDCKDSLSPLTFSALTKVSQKVLVPQN